MKRRLFMAAAMLAGVLFGVPAALAEYPERPIKLIILQAPGGSNDILGRKVAEELGEKLGQTIVVENIAGGGGNIGLIELTKAEPDGYTFVMGVSTLVIKTLVYENLPFTLEDFAPIGMVGQSALVVSTSPSVPAKTIQEFIAYAQENKGSLNFGSSDLGGSAHILAETLNKQADLGMQRIAYKGASEYLADLMAGRIQLVFDALPSSAGPAAEGKINIAAVVAPERLESLPEVPTLREAGYPIDVTVWWGIFGPAGTPDDIRERVNAAINEVTSDPTFQADLKRMNFLLPEQYTVSEFEDFIADNTATWQSFLDTIDYQKLSN